MDENSTYEDIADLENRRDSIDACIGQLGGAYHLLFLFYERFSSCRAFALKFNKVLGDVGCFFTNLQSMQEMFDAFPLLNTPEYTWFVQRYRNCASYVDYAVELPKIKQRILESEIDWYIENIVQDLEMVKKEKHSSVIKSVVEQYPDYARHTRMVINHALEQLEIIASKITTANAKDYVKDVERYTWCLAAMVPLLSEEEQDPFKEGGLHQRWQKARNKISDIDI